MTLGGASADRPVAKKSPPQGLLVAGDAPIVAPRDHRVAAGGSACVIVDGKVACWGANHFRQLGFVGGDDCKSSLACSTTPCLVEEVPAARSVVAGESTMCMVDREGRVFCWGEGNVGQLGPEPADRCGNELNIWPCSAKPVRIEGLAGVVDLAVDSHLCAVTEGGKVLCWGSNASGELGAESEERCIGNLAIPRQDGPRFSPLEGRDPGLACSRVPLLVRDIPPAQQVAVGRSHTCALTTAGEVYCWGGNQRGELGIGSTVNEAPPTIVPGLKDIVAISAGMGNTCAIERGGRLYCWGDNSSGQLGYVSQDRCLQGIVSCSRKPGKVFDDVVEARISFTHGCLRTSGGAVHCWGLDSDGQIGSLGADRCNEGRQTCAATPKLVPDLHGVRALSVGNNFTCVIRGEALECWGRNALGALGDGTTTSRARAMPVVEAGRCP